MKNETLLSVVVIGYNVESFIECILTQLKNQSNNKVEVLFVDDGSKDNTKKIVQNIIKNKNNFKYIYKENDGANSARIRGYQEANGKYLTFIDGDDQIDDEYISKILNVINEENDIITFNYNYLYDNKDIVANKEYPIKKVEEYDFLKNILCSEIPHFLWNKVYKIDFLKKIKFENIPKITMGDDLVACVIMGLNKPNVKIIKDKLYNYYVNVNSVSRKSNSKFIEMIKVLDSIEENVKKYGLEKKYEKEIEFQYFRTFYYYVVKNSCSSTEIPKKIYKKYKNKKININNNIIIKGWLKQKSKLERVLVKIYLMDFNIGYFFSRIYLNLKRTKKR